jgi:SAM-dependent methyltransferase
LRASYLYPYAALRAGLAERVDHFAKQIQGGVLVDVGCGTRPYENLFNVDQYIGVDVYVSGRSLRAKRPDLWYDGEHLPFEDESVDHVLCTQVLQYVRDPHAFVRELSRVLRVGGTLILTAPQSEPTTESPFDRFRYTEAGLSLLCTEHAFELVEIAPVIGFWQSIAYDINASVGDSLIGRGPLGKFTLSALGLATQSVAWLLDHSTSSRRNVNAWALSATRVAIAERVAP